MVERLEAALGYAFAAPELAVEALTHPSFAAENRLHAGHYQRLEFVGDAFLGMVVGGFLLALLHQAVEFIGERIDGGVHVRCGRFGMDIGARHAQRGLRRVPQLLDGQHAMGIDQLVEVTHDAFHLFDHVGAHRFGDLDMASGDFDLHGLILLIVIRKAPSC